MKLKVYTNTQLNIKETAKIYAGRYGHMLAELAIKGIDRLDDFLVNHK